MRQNSMNFMSVSRQSSPFRKGGVLIDISGKVQSPVMLMTEQCFTTPKIFLLHQLNILVI